MRIIPGVTMNDQRELELIRKALEVSNETELIKTIIENVGNVRIEDIGNLSGNEFEIFMKPSGFNQNQLEDLQQIFTIREIGIYGDPDLPNDTIYFHMIVKL